jgi:glycosyltransferase involved in cell wall biosynthesis
MSKRIALFSPYLEHIGEARTVPALARALADRGYAVDLLRAWEEWDDADLGQTGQVRVVSLRTKRLVPVLPSIARWSRWANYRLQAGLVAAGMLPGMRAYLRREHPEVLVARMLTLPAIIGTALARTDTRLVLSMAGLPRSSGYRNALWPRLYGRADAYVAPVREVAAQAARLSEVPVERFHIIPNPVIEPGVLAAADAPLEHPWFTQRTGPVVLGVGRLTRQKDFPTLLRAFALVRREVPTARLVIFGEGEQRADLETLAASLGITEAVDLPGFEPNPYRYMRAADAFVMSSEWEGPGHVLIEAMAVGSPCVSTDCPAGPRDTLEDGRLGRLVPVADPPAMATAITGLLTHPDEARALGEAGRAAAGRFTPDAVGERWDALVRELVGPAHG